MLRSSPRRELRWYTPRLLPRGEGYRAQCVLLDEYDWWHFRRIAAHDEQLHRRLAATPEIQRLAFDMYGMLYKPRLAWATKRAVHLNRVLLQRVADRAELKKLRRRTVLSEWASVTALRALLGPLEQAFHEARKAAQEQGRRAKRQTGDGPTTTAQDLEAATEGLTGAQLNFATQKHANRALSQRLDKYCDTVRAINSFDAARTSERTREQARRRQRSRRLYLYGRKAPEEPPAAMPGLDAPERDERHVLISRMRALRESFEELQRTQRALNDRATEDVETGADRDLERAFEEIGKSVREALALVDGVLDLYRESDSWGRSPGHSQDVPLHHMLALGKALQGDKSVRELVEIVGRWSFTMKRRVARRKSARMRTELHGVTVGDDLDRLLPSELLLLRHPRLKSLLLKRVFEGQALVAEVRGPDLLGRGPVILAIDTSGSMAGARLMVAKALSLALALRCWEKKRPFHVLTFGSPAEMEEITFPARSDFWDRFQACLGLSFGGGTDFDGPLRRIVELTREHPWSQADAVVLTDGYCDVARPTLEELRRAKRATDLQLLGVLLADGNGLRDAADVTYTIDTRGISRGGDGTATRRILQHLGGRV